MVFCLKKTPPAAKKATPTSGGKGKKKGGGATAGVGEVPDPPEPNIAVSLVHDNTIQQAIIFACSEMVKRQGNH